MIGSEGVARHVMLTIQNNMPAKLAELRQRLSVSSDELPEVMRYYAHDIDELEVGGFPAVLVTETESTGNLGVREVVFGEQADEYTFEYIMRIYLWAMGDSAGGTALLAKRLVGAVEEILLQNKLIYSGHDGDEFAKLDPKHVKHSYSDAAVDGAKHVLSAAYVEVHIATRELLGAPALIIPTPALSELNVTLTMDTPPV
jgi:hypothetical protein